MTDRELLESAAKAAGIDINIGEGSQEEGGWLWPIDNSTGKTWNPLTDDGDALRLAVKLNMNLTYDTSPDGAFVFASCSWSGGEESNEVDLGKDAYAATRRAIVRAAAEIARNMK